jgi:hypothetical protein
MAAKEKGPQPTNGGELPGENQEDVQDARKEVDPASLVRHTAGDAIKVTGFVAEDLVGAVHRVINAIIGTAGSVAEQALREVGKVLPELVSVVTAVSRAVVQSADEIGGDLGAMTRKGLAGVVETTREVGGEVASIATDAAEGTIDATRKLSLTAAEGTKEVVEKILVWGASPGAVDFGTAESWGEVKEGEQASLPITQAYG